MKVYFCYEYMKANDSRTPTRVKKIFADKNKCFDYLLKKEEKEIERLEKIHGIYNYKKHIEERIHGLEVTE